MGLPCEFLSPVFQHSSRTVPALLGAAWQDPSPGRGTGRHPVSLCFAVSMGESALTQAVQCGCRRGIARERHRNSAPTPPLLGQRLHFNKTPPPPSRAQSLRSTGVTPAPCLFLCRHRDSLSLWWTNALELENWSPGLEIRVYEGFPAGRDSLGLSNLFLN